MSLSEAVRSMMHSLSGHGEFTENEPRHPFTRDRHSSKLTGHSVMFNTADALKLSLSISAVIPTLQHSATVCQC